MILVHFQGKPFNITVFQVCSPATDAEEADIDQFYEDLQDLLELTPNQGVLYKRYLGLNEVVRVGS